MYQCVVDPAHEFIRATNGRVRDKEVLCCVSTVGQVAHDFTWPAIFDNHFDKVVAVRLEADVLVDVGANMRAFKTDVVPVFVGVKVP
jgi:hypothetical protein